MPEKRTSGKEMPKLFRKRNAEKDCRQYYAVVAYPDSPPDLLFKRRKLGEHSMNMTTHAVFGRHSRPVNASHENGMASEQFQFGLSNVKTACSRKQANYRKGEII